MIRAALALAVAGLAGCGGVGPLRPPTPPVVVETTLQPGTYRAGAAHAVGATFVNRSTRPVVAYGDRLLGLRLVGAPEFTAAERRAARTDTVTTWARSYTLAYDHPAAGTLELPLTVVGPNGRFAFPAARVRWPDDPGRYQASVCTLYAPGERDAPREVCAPPVAVELR